MTPEDEKLPAELRVPPTGEPEVEVDEAGAVPPEAAVVATAHHAGPAAGTAAADAAYRADVAAEAAGEQAHLPPAELRVPPDVEPDVEVRPGDRVPPEAGVVAHPPTER